jgi:transcriptional regulator with XRE-family HTH domain
MCKQALKEKAKNLVMDMLIEARQKGYTFEDIAENIGASPKSIQHYLYGEQIPSLPVAFGIHRTVKSKAFANAIAKEAGGIFVELPEVNESHFSILSKKTASSLQEFSEFLNTVGDSLADNRITKGEVERIKKEGFEAIEKILEIIKTVEEMAR